ncbi:MAG: hypothetical protein ACJ8FY_11115 [Gemmataceae bacterium]
MNAVSLPLWYVGNSTAKNVGTGLSNGGTKCFWMFVNEDVANDFVQSESLDGYEPIRVAAIEDLNMILNAASEKDCLHVKIHTESGGFIMPIASLLETIRRGPDSTN